LRDKEGKLTSSSDYWSFYYEELETNFPPSQFASFTAGEMSALTKDMLIFDLGGGDGRDIKFFAGQGFKTIYVDQVNGLGTQQFASVFLGDLTSIDLWEQIGHEIKSAPDTVQIVFYCRFVLHCFNENELGDILSLLKENTVRSRTRVFIEYRTNYDEYRPKATPVHERFFHSNDTVNSVLNSLQYEIIYEVEGTGFAKFQNDDAYVRRLILAL